MLGHIITIDNAGLGRRPRNLDSKWSMGYNPNMREYEPAYENATSLYSPEPEEIHVSTSLSLKPSASVSNDFTVMVSIFISLMFVKKLN
jgi:hypothetical protein